jgi:hypothetical protein
MALYVVDSNFFIEAHRVTYPLDVAVGFWNKVLHLANDGIIVSIDKVKDEIYECNDGLKAWCQANLPSEFFINSDEFVDEYVKVAAWASSRSKHYLPKALNEFLDADKADAFIVACALADSQNRIIVTQEVSEPNRKNKIKIPDCCNALGVRYINTVEMFRKLGETF